MFVRRVECCMCRALRCETCGRRCVGEREKDGRREREGEDQVDSLNHMLSVSIDRRSFIKMLLLTVTEEEEKIRRK